MILDSLLRLSEAQVLAAAAPSQNSIDLKQNRDIGIGKPMWVVCAVTTAIVGTLQLEIQTDDNSAFGSPTTIAAGELLAAPAAGTLIAVQMPRANERYLRARLGGAPTAGVVDVYLTSEPPPGWQAYPAAKL